MTAKKKPSERNMVAQHCADFIIANNLATPYGVILTEDQNKKKYYVIHFCKPKILTGTINVYSTKFIIVQFETNLGALPHQGKIKFTSVEKVMEFIKAAFIDYNFDQALAMIKESY